MSKDFDPHVVASSFIKQFYEKLSKNPNELYRFYKDESFFTHSDGQQPSEPVAGVESIRVRVAELNLAGSKVDISDGSIDAHRSENNGVVIVATGLFTAFESEISQPFVQTFFLSAQPQHASTASYFVRNSVFRLIEQKSINKKVTAVSASTLTDNSSEISRDQFLGTEVHVDDSIDGNVVTEGQEADGVNVQPISESSFESVPVSSEPATFDGYEPTVEEETVIEDTDGATAVEDNDEDPIDDVDNEVEEEGIIEVYVEDSNEEKTVDESNASTDTSTESATFVQPSNSVVDSLATEPTNTVTKPRSWLDALRSQSDSPLVTASPTHAKPASSKPTSKPRVIAPPPVSISTSTGNSSTSDSKGVQQAGTFHPPAPPRSEEHRFKHSVFLGNVRENVTDSDIRAAFDVFGKIVQVDVKASKGFAFVEFDNLDSVKTVLTFGKPIKIGDRVLNIQERSVSSNSSGVAAAGNKRFSGKPATSMTSKDKHRNNNKDNSVANNNKDNKERYHNRDHRGKASNSASSSSQLDSSDDKN